MLYKTFIAMSILCLGLMGSAHAQPIWIFTGFSGSAVNLDVNAAQGFAQAVGNASSGSSFVNSPFVYSNSSAGAVAWGTGSAIAVAQSNAQSTVISSPVSEPASGTILFAGLAAIAFVIHRRLRR